MINKIYKTIHNKFSTFFNFKIFFRYIFPIFFVAMVFFLIIPQSFDYKKKEEIIKLYLFENYGLQIKQMGEIEFRSFPFPNLKIKNIKSNLKSERLNLTSKNLIIYPSLFSIYNFRNFNIKKIEIEDIYIKSNFVDLKNLLISIKNLKKKIYLKNLDIRIIDEEKNILDLKKINFSNFGYKKNVIDGEVFKRKFRVKFSDNFRIINFKLINTGVTVSLKILEKNKNSNYVGVFKGKILNSNFKLNFVYNTNLLKIKNLLFREKDLSFDSNGNLILKPFPKIELNTVIKNINLDLIQNLNIKNLLNYKHVIKKFNSKNIINFKSKIFSNYLIDDLNIEFSIAHGRLNISKIFFISDSKFSCKGNTNLLDEFPVFFFNCLMEITSSKNLLKKMKIDLNKKDKNFDLEVKGNLNILNNKINFDYIKINENQKKSKDLEYYKTIFENVVFDKDFQSIFSFSKIRNFILKIS